MTRETYQLPINVIIEVMKGLHERVAFRTHIPTLPLISKEECAADIVVGETGLQVCAITEKNTGRVLCQYREAFDILQQCGVLEWMILPQEQSRMQERSSHHLSSSFKGMSEIPFRQVALTSAQVQALPHGRKKVFALVDGRNTVEHIAHLLSKTPQEVYLILLELQKKQWIHL